MFLAVTCKNPDHYNQNPFHGYRIRVQSRSSERFAVQCDSCNRTYWYDPPEVLDMAG